MDNENLNTTAPGQDEETMLPEGYTGEEDIFGEGADGEEAFTDAQEMGEGPESAENVPEEGTETPAGGENGEEPAPDTEQEDAPPAESTLKFKNVETEVSVKESDLPGIYQRAQAHAGLAGEIAKLRGELEAVNANARAMGFESAQQMMAKAAENYRESEVKRLVAEGMHEEAAKDLVERKMQATKPEPVVQSQQTAPARDFRREIAELVQQRPELREQLANGGKLPQEVITACVKDGVPLRVAYAEYEIREVRAEAERVRQENEILKQNAANAAKAPVKSVTAGGSAAPRSKDPFLMGFEADN